MDPVKTHYDQLLGSVYSWILGDFDTAYASNAALFDRLGIQPTGNRIAVDLGAGPGCQSLPLAARGFDVTAIDFCADLLDELRNHRDAGNVTAVLADVRRFSEHLPSSPELIVCMGDTLVHLPSHADAHRLLEEAAAALAPAGRIVISIRDYDRPGPTGADRFIPIRSDENRIFTCFLEYDDDVVHVHDILQQRQDGEWQLSVSGYRKLRLSMDRVADTLIRGGLTVECRTDDKDMRVLQARKPDA